MHYWEISMICLRPGNLGKDLRATIKKKRLCRKKMCLLISLSENFIILHLNSFKNNLEKPETACM